MTVQTINGDILNTADALNTDEIVINWSGNEFSFEYQYTLEYLTQAPGDFAVKSTSGWIKDQSGVMSHLDDGEYRFIIRSRYDADHEEAGGDSILFTIDAVTGPALRFYPLHQTISAGSPVYLYLYIEEIQDLTAMELHLSYTTAPLQIIAVNPANMLLGASAFYEDLEYGDGMVRIIASSNDFNEINGTGEIAKLTFTSQETGSAEIIIQTTSPYLTQLRDSVNTALQYIVKNATVDVY